MAQHTLLVISFIVLSSFVSATAKIGCQTPQYLEIGKPGTIVCYFHDAFYSIHWYYNLDVKDGPPTLSYERQEKGGEGYETGEFDIYQNGSLIVKNVSVQHEAMFTVYEFEQEQELPQRHDIHIITIIRPTPAFPVVDECSTNSGVCYIQWTQQIPLECRIQQARPAMALTWVARTIDGDMNVTNKPTIYANHTNTWSSSVFVTDPFIYSSYLVVLICKVDDPMNLLQQNQITILIHRKEQDASVYDTTDISVERDGKVTFPCTNGEYQLLVWEHNSPNSNTNTTALYHIVTAGKAFVEPNDYELKEGNLVIDVVKIHHEGIYTCTYSDGTHEGMSAVDLTVYVRPVPGHPIIEGCNHEQYCVLEVNYTGRLTCTVKGIRPAVKLEWRAYHEDSSKMILFHKQQLDTESNGETSDVTLVTDYIVETTADKRLTVECRSVGPNSNHFPLTSKIDLLFPGQNVKDTTDKYVTTNSSDQLSDNTGPIIIIVVVVAVIILIGVLLFYTVHRLRRNRLRSSNVNEENIPLMKTADEVFISQLKSIYENLYSAVKPIPFLPGNFTVHELYVDGGIEYFSKTKKEESWESIESYKNIFTYPKMKGNRWIIEGEAGYGKSVLSLQLAYEWCHAVEGSFMCDVTIFILIRLRQLKEVSSIYEAVKRFILPINSQFTIAEIKGFIDKCSSVLIILDGFDEYPDRDSNPNSDVFNIIKRNMFPECKVMLTTRPSQLPNDYAAQTNRLRLTGFKNKAQEEYLRKVVIFNGHTSAEDTIKEWIEDNPILGALCQVPLFFAMYAHLSLESDDLKKCTSVTSFFRYMITCLHSHLKLKFKDENADSFEFNANNHQELDEICFDSLNGHLSNPDINKDELIQKLGKEFLEQYLAIGILREDKNIVVTNEPGIQISDHVKTVSNVRFYHSLFCEWFAAHHVVYILDKISNSPGRHNEEEGLVILEDLEPSLHQYVYRFACGIKPKAAKYILNYLQNGVGNKMCSMLCILEQAGNVDTILENVREICSDTVYIKGQDSTIIHKSVLILLEIAVNKKFTIPKLVLNECIKAVHPSVGEIVLNTDVRLPLLNDVERLWLEQARIELSLDEMEDIFNYSLQCRNLKEVSFVYSLLPYHFNRESTLELLNTKGIRVLWYIAEEGYCMDLKSGKWQKRSGSSPMTEEEYPKVVAIFRLM